MTLREKVLMVKNRPKGMSLPSFYEQNKGEFNSFADVRKCSRIVSKIQLMESQGNLSGVSRLYDMCDNETITSLTSKISNIDFGTFSGGQSLDEMITQIKSNTTNVTDNVIVETLDAALDDFVNSIIISGILDTKIKMDTTRLDLVIQLLQVVRNTNVITD